MARTCTICRHPARVEIDKALIDGTANRRIAAQHAVAETSLRRHKADHLARLLAESGPFATAVAHPADRAGSIVAHAAQRAVDDLDIRAQLRRHTERVNLLSDACDAWLRDPDDPSRYTLDPRAEDLMVLYEDLTDRTRGGDPKRKRATLADLLERVSSLDIAVQVVERKHADPRELVLKTADAAKAQMTLLVTVLDKLHSQQQVEAFRAAVLAAIDEAAPDVRDRIIEKLQQRRPLV